MTSVIVQKFATKKLIYNAYGPAEVQYRMTLDSSRPTNLSHSVLSMPYLSA